MISDRSIDADDSAQIISREPVFLQKVLQRLYAPNGSRLG
jgi:hypothetical protein